jgi:23S rRNA U2552 (ribose-2'-O)-methylase RlmE/FtsJ
MQQFEQALVSVPLIYELPTIKPIKLDNFDPSYSKFRSPPRCEYGFNQFIHQSKNKSEELNDTKYRNKFYLVTNPYEINIKQYDKDIQSMTELYFQLNKDGIISRAFYKLWEILLTFDLINQNTAINSFHLAEAPGAFIQAAIFYRKKFNPTIKNDKFNCISIKADKTGIPFKKENLNACLSDIKIEEGDLTDINIQKSFQENNGEADFITADGGFEWKNENFQEQEAFRLILAEIISALRMQKQNGNFVLKIFETFTNITVKIILILSTYYDKVYIHKPLTSRPTNSERYLICLKYKGINKKELNLLDNFLSDINSKEMKQSYIFNYLADIEIPENFKLVITTSSLEILNIQYKTINERINYIHSKNYYGDIYEKYKQNQIKAYELWTNTYLPLDNEMIKQIKKNIKEILATRLELSASQINNLKKRLNDVKII